MNIKLKNRVIQRLRSDVEEFARLESVWNENKERSEYRDLDLDLSALTRAECERLRDVLRTCGIPGTKPAAADITKYLRAAVEGVDKMTARVVRQAAWMLEHFFAHLPHHMIFSQDDFEGGSHVGYYVEDVTYVPERENGRGHHVEHEHVKIDLAWVDLDSRASKSVRWYAGDVVGEKPAEMLAGDGYVAETPELMERLRVETERYYEVKDQIGKKFVARGLARDDLDDASGRSTECMRVRSRARVSVVRMDLRDVPSPVVVDVLSEKGEKDDGDHGGGGYVNLYRWHPWNMRFHSPGEDDLARHLEADEDTDFAPELQLPVHPLVPCFDLRRHARVRCHVNNLTEYEYRPEVARGLVIPERDRALVDLLVDQASNDFQDVVGGKGQSLNILAGGSPGTGKTLTAEVFAEFKRRPLYSVQCSQLGTKPEEIEQRLGVILARANRWGAILLLDEADVYVRRRGADLDHNAIVGVFLRVLEYAQCVLFMTTNLADDVDDAIASRCIVRIEYGVPSAADQARIWRMLADLNRIDLPDETIDEWVARHPRISGRDVKNLLKLASFVSARDGRPIDLGALEFALQYKATADADPAGRACATDRGHRCRHVIGGGDLCQRPQGHAGFCSVVGEVSR